MKIRIFQQGDLAEFERLADEARARFHERTGRNLLVAHPNDPANSFSLVAIDEDGTMAAAATARHSVEAFLVPNHDWGTPQERWELVQRLLQEGGERCRALGVKELACPTTSWRFAKRLMSLPGAHGDPRPHVIFFLNERAPGAAPPEPGDRLLVPLEAIA